MKSRQLFSSLLFPLLTWSVDVHSQVIDYPVHFLELVNQANLEFFEPIEAGYRAVHVQDNEFQQYDFGIRSGKEKLEIRYFILPWNENNPYSTQPNITAFRAVTNAATNADEAVISAIQPAKETLEKDFNADWGMVYFFQPKPGFANSPFCRMVALAKEGQATVLVFYLFDDPGNAALDTRYLAVRFL